MPLMLDNIRAEFARFLADDPNARFRMDAALAHVVTKAYQQGLDDGTRAHHLPASNHKPSDISEAFEWLRTEATKDGADERAGIVLDEWHALAAGKMQDRHPIPAFLHK